MNFSLTKSQIVESVTVKKSAEPLRSNVEPATPHVFEVLD